MVVTCTGCAAAWEVHNSLVRRIGDPDWGVVREIRADAPAVVRAAADLVADAPRNEFADHSAERVSVPSIGAARAHVRRAGQVRRIRERLRSTNL